jgi:hypothetical protein
MIRILHDLLVFSCLAAFVTGDRARASEAAHLRGRDLKGSAGCGETYQWPIVPKS